MAIEGPNPTAFRRELARAVVLPPVLFAGLAAVFLGLIAHLLAVIARIDRSDTVIARTSRIQALLVDMQDGERLGVKDFMSRESHGAAAGGRPPFTEAGSDYIAGAPISLFLRPDSSAHQAIVVDHRAKIDVIRGRLAELLRVAEAVRSRRNESSCRQFGAPDLMKSETGRFRVEDDRRLPG